VEPARSQWLKGVLDLAVLAVLNGSDGYGYDVVRRLREAGLAEVREASVYGTLRRLFQAGHVHSYVVPSEEGPPRKYYGLSDRGRQHLDTARTAWQSFSKSIEDIVGHDRKERT
jgi:PadR family transcriptional regulator PadR